MATQKMIEEAKKVGVTIEIACSEVFESGTEFLTKEGRPVYWSDGKQKFFYSNGREVKEKKIRLIYQGISLITEDHDLAMWDFANDILYTETGLFNDANPGRFEEIFSQITQEEIEPPFGS